MTHSSNAGQHEERSAARPRSLADHPWLSGVGGFLAAALCLLPVEYEAALRSALLFLSIRRL